MKAILRIARTELNCLFYSPIAWLLLIVFILQTSMSYVNLIGTLASRQYAGGAGEDKITAFVFSSSRRLFSEVQGDLYYYVPLLTMGLIARELYSGSIKLLQSSPITLRQMILGKYLAIVGYFFLFVLFLLSLMLMTGAMVEHLDYALALSGLLGIFLLASTYAAIGLYMSSLTTHQVVAAIGTFAVLFVLGFVGRLGQSIPFVGELAYWLSISGRADYLRTGLVASKDVLYYLSIIVLFLSFTYLKLSSGRKIESDATKAAKYVGVLLAVGVFGYVTSLPALTLYKDTTREQTQSLSAGSEAIMQDITGPWRVTAYANLLSNRGRSFLPRSQRRLERYLFEPFWRANPELKVEYVYYYGPSDNQRLYEQHPGKSDEELAREFAYKRRLDFDDFLSVEEVSRLTNVETERFDNFYVVEWNGQSTVLRNFADVSYYPSERELSAALKRLRDGPAKVAFVAGHGERGAFKKGDTDYQLVASERTYRQGMRNQGFDVEELSLNRALPEDLDILVIAAPEQPYSSHELATLKAYIDAGGNLLVAGEPGLHEILNPIFESLGVEFIDGRIVEPKQDYPKEFIFGRLTDKAGDYSFEVGEFEVDQPYVVNGAAALRYTRDGPFEAIAILEADGSGAFLQSDELVAFDDTALAVAMRREVNGKEQRLMILADADLMSTTELTRRTMRTNNQDFVPDMLAWLSNGEYPVDTSRAPFIDRDIDLEIEDVVWLKFLLYGLLPMGLFVWGGSLLIMRHRQ